MQSVLSVHRTGLFADDSAASLAALEAPLAEMISSGIPVFINNPLGRPDLTALVTSVCQVAQRTVVVVPTWPAVNFSTCDQDPQVHLLIGSPNASAAIRKEDLRHLFIASALAVDERWNRKSGQPPPWGFVLLDAYTSLRDSISLLNVANAFNFHCLVDLPARMLDPGHQAQNPDRAFDAFFLAHIEQQRLVAPPTSSCAPVIT